MSDCCGLSWQWVVFGLRFHGPRMRTWGDSAPCLFEQIHGAGLGNDLWPSKTTTIRLRGILPPPRLTDSAEAEPTAYPASVVVPPTTFRHLSSVPPTLVSASWLPDVVRQCGVGRLTVRRLVTLVCYGFLLASDQLPRLSNRLFPARSS